MNYPPEECSLKDKQRLITTLLPIYKQDRNTMKILVAEDEEAIAELYKIILTHRGHQVKLTRDGLECIDVYNNALAQLHFTSDDQLARNPPFDVVMLDYRMPKMDGLEAAKLILDANKHQRIIFTSAYVLSTLQESVKYLDAVIELLQKPFDQDDMVEIIEGRKSKQELKEIEQPFLERPRGQLESAQDQLPEIKHALSVGTEATKPEMLVIAGLSLAKKGRVVEALKCLLHAIELNPNNAKTWYNIAICLGMLENDQHSPLMIYCYDQAIHINPGDVEAWNNKGAILDLMGNKKYAMECYKRALDINPRHGKARRNLYLRPNW